MFCFISNLLCNSNLIYQPNTVLCCQPFQLELLAHSFFLIPSAKGQHHSLSDFTNSTQISKKKKKKQKQTVPFHTIILLFYYFFNKETFLACHYVSPEEYSMRLQHTTHPPSMLVRSTFPTIHEAALPGALCEMCYLELSAAHQRQDYAVLNCPAHSTVKSFPYLVLNGLIS